MNRAGLGEMGDTGGGAHDIHNRIHSANLMEMNLLDRHIVDFGLRRAKHLKCVDGGSLDRVGQGSGLNQLANDGQRAGIDVGMAVVVLMAVGMLFVRV